MKNNKIQFEQYLKNVYRQDNGNSLKPQTINDYTCLCNKAGEYLGLRRDDIFQIGKPSIIKFYMPKIQLISKTNYVRPETLISPLKAYMGFLTHQENKKIN